MRLELGDLALVWHLKPNPCLSPWNKISWVWEYVFFLKKIIIEFHILEKFSL